MGARLRFSVILPVEDDRGLVEQAVRAWAKDQRFDRDRFELVLVTRDDDPSLRLLLDPMLSPQDRWLPTQGNFSQRYDAGARAARGEYLLFTESHCVPDPGLLVEVDHHFAQHAAVGVCCRSKGIVRNEMARLDQMLHDEGIDEFKKVDDWRKVDIHAFALSRDAYDDVGGFDFRYDRFSERVIAWRLHQRGHHLDYLPTAIVHHAYRTTWRELFVDFHGYTRGEILYRWAHPGPDHVHFTYFEGCHHPGSPESPFHYVPAAHALGVHLAGTIARALPAWGGGRALAFLAWLRLVGRWGPYLPVGPAWPRFVAALRLGWSILGLTLSRAFVVGLETNYRALWKHGLWRGGLLALAHESLPPVGPLERPWLSPDVVHEIDLFNWHGFEVLDGRTLRWSDELSAMRLRVLPGDYRLHWTLDGLRTDLAPEHLRFFCNGRRIPPERLALTRDEICLDLRAEEMQSGEEQVLAFYCRASCPWKHDMPDGRRLGLPLLRLELERRERLEGG